VAYIGLAPDPGSRFPRASHGEVGLEEGWFGAKFVRSLIAADRNGTPRPIITVVDSKSQAYGRREELAGIHLAAAAVIAAFAEARMAGHPVIALIVGRAVSGSFLTLCGQANRILAFNDPVVLVHAMYKDAAARITRRSVAELDQLGERIVRALIASVVRGRFTGERDERSLGRERCNRQNDGQEPRRRHHVATNRRYAIAGEIAGESDLRQLGRWLGPVVPD